MITSKWITKPVKRKKTDLMEDSRPPIDPTDCTYLWRPQEGLCRLLEEISKPYPPSLKEGDGHISMRSVTSVDEMESQELMEEVEEKNNSEESVNAAKDPKENSDKKRRKDSGKERRSSKESKSNHDQRSTTTNLK